MPLPKRRGIYFLEPRPPGEGGLYIWIRHRQGEEGEEAARTCRNAQRRRRLSWRAAQFLAQIGLTGTRVRPHYLPAYSLEAPEPVG